MSLEVYKKPSGFVDLYMLSKKPEFVPIGTEPNQGYFIIPKDSVVKELHEHNLIVNNASLLVAKRMRPGTSWGTGGILYLEFGTGYGTGSTSNPQAESATQTALRVPLIRKAISSWTNLDAGGNATGSDTNTLQLSTVIGDTEGIGQICEMGFFGGDATSSMGSGFMYNYKVFSAWNKQSGMTLTAVWKLVF